MRKFSPERKRKTSSRTTCRSSVAWNVESSATPCQASSRRSARSRSPIDGSSVMIDPRMNHFVAPCFKLKSKFPASSAKTYTRSMEALCLKGTGDVGDPGRRRWRGTRGRAVESLRFLEVNHVGYPLGRDGAAPETDAAECCPASTPPASSKHVQDAKKARRVGAFFAREPRRLGFPPVVPRASSGANSERVNR